VFCNYCEIELVSLIGPVCTKTCSTELVLKVVSSKNIVKLTPRLNFISVPCTAFTRADPESVKDTDDLNYFTLLGSSSVKAAHKTLVKLTPESWIGVCLKAQH